MDLLIELVWFHFVADFLLQTNSMAVNKSSSNLWLLIHVLTYSVVFLPIGVEYAIINGAAHFVVDFISSRATTWAWERKKRRLFFNIIGLDQAIHLTTLIATANWMGIS